jgi:D-sedoheptulose 7-phosphate isomerase
VTLVSDAVPAAVGALFERRVGPLRALAEQAGELVRAAHAVAARFHGGGKLIVFGTGGACTDAEHIAVEFVHPVIVGKRALPALSLTSDVATLTGVAERHGLSEVFDRQLRLLAEPGDIALGLCPDGGCANVVRGLEYAREHGLLTVALVGADENLAADSVADHVLRADAADPRVVKEVHVTAYHILWELVHLFLEQPGAFGPERVSG